MGSPVSTIPNLGPASEAAFARAGIATAQEVRALGADAACVALLRSGTPAHFIGYCALAPGLQGRPWTDTTPAEKAALRARFDALKAEAAGTDQRLAAALDALGVVARRPG